MTALLGCSSGTLRSAPISNEVTGLSDAEVVRQAVTHALGTVSGIDTACLEQELASIPADFSFLAGAEAAAAGSNEDNGSGDSPATDPPAVTSPPDSGAPPAAGPTTPSIPDPFDVLSNNSCGGNLTENDALQHLVNSPVGEEMVVRSLAATYQADATPPDVTCLRSVVHSAGPKAIADIVSGAETASDDVAAKLDACAGI
jgi:hypothetical protein